MKALGRTLGDVKDRVAGRLVSAGALVEDRPRLAGVLAVTRYRLRDEEVRERVRDDLRGWIAGPTSSVEARPATLVALLEACHLLGEISDDRAERRRASARAQAVMDEIPAARAVRAIVDEVRSTAAAAAVITG